MNCAIVIVLLLLIPSVWMVWKRVTEAPEVSPAVCEPSAPPTAETMKREVPTADQIEFAWYSLLMEMDYRFGHHMIELEIEVLYLRDGKNELDQIA